MSSKKIIPNQKFFEEVRGLLAQARQQAYAAVNFAMVEAYWQIGRRIVEEEQQGKGRADYGDFLIKELSRHLTSKRVFLKSIFAIVAMLKTNKSSGFAQSL